MAFHDLAVSLVAMVRKSSEIRKMGGVVPAGNQFTGSTLPMKRILAVFGIDVFPNMEFGTIH